MSKRLPHIFSWLVAALIFFIPSNLFLVLNESWGYINGLRVDYVLPKLFFTDLLIFPIIYLGLWFKRTKMLFWLKHNRWLVFVGLLLFIAQLFTTHTLTSLFTLIKGIEFGLLFVVLIVNKDLLKTEKIGWAMIASIIFQLILALYQFIFQKSATPYWLTGESQLTSSMIGLARSSFGGEERLLAYGTTAHPNILAGVAVLFFLIYLHIRRSNNMLWLLLPIIVILFITQSWSAVLALVIGLLVTFKKDLITSNILRILLFVVIIIPFFIDILSDSFTDTSLTRRAALHAAALEMLESKPLLGVGLNNFTVVLEDYLHQKEFVRFIQPVHNSLWLLAAETGVLGLWLFWMICKKILKKFILSPLMLTLIPLLSLDHYLTSTQTGVLALLVFLVFTLNQTSSHHQE